MKADSISNSTPTSDYLKPVLTPANAGGLPASGPTGPPPPGPELALNVECGPNKAWFYVGRLCQGSKGPCVLFNGAWLTPNEFQYVSGRETAKDWKRSIRHHGKSMKLLMTKGILAISPPVCQCDVCTGCAENNNNLDVNKRAAEIAARKAAAEAAAGLDPTGKTSSINERTSGMADSGALGAEDRLTDDGGSVENSPAKESRLTNIIEAIKSKKKKDDGSSSDSSAQKENRPNSRPSSRSGNKKRKEHGMENGIASHDESSTQNSPVPMSTLDVTLLPRPDITLYPTVSTAPGSITRNSQEATPDADPAPLTSQEDEEEADSDVDPCDDVIPDDVSRTRPYDWSTRKAKNVAPEVRPQTEFAHVNHADVTPAPSSRTSSPAAHTYPINPVPGAPLHASPGLPGHIPPVMGPSRDALPHGHPDVALPPCGTLSPGGGRRLSPLPHPAGRWSPTSSLPKVMTGTDSKPPLLSANRSITTATSCITKPIVSTGTAMFTSALPKDMQREAGNKESSPKEETSKVYAPINWPPVASEVNETKVTDTKVNTNSQVHAPSSHHTPQHPNSQHHQMSPSSSSSRVSETSSKLSVDPSAATHKSSSHHLSSSTSTERHASPEKANSGSGGDERGRPSPPNPKVAAKATEVAVSSSYSEYLRHLGRVPGAPPPGMDDESYIAMMRRYYEWYELSRLYGPYGMPPTAPPPSSAGLPRSGLPPHHPAAYDQHSLLSMYHPYYYPHHPAAADPYRALGGTPLPQEWARLSALTEAERESLLVRQREAEKESASSSATTGSPQGLKRAYPGEMSREEALDLSVNKKQKLAESLAAHDSAALLYGLHASGFRPPHFAALGAPGAGYPGSVGSLELAAAYPGLWGLPHSHPGASLSHSIPTTATSMHHPGLAAYAAHPLTAGSRPSTTASTVTSSAASAIHKDLLHGSHRQEAPTLAYDKKYGGLKLPGHSGMYPGYQGPQPVNTPPYSGHSSRYFTFGRTLALMSLWM